MTNGKDFREAFSSQKLLKMHTHVNVKILEGIDKNRKIQLCPETTPRILY